MHWAYDGEGTYWQLYCDERSIVLPRATDEAIVREVTAALNVAAAARTIFGYIEPELKGGPSVRLLADALDNLDAAEPVRPRA